MITRPPRSTRTDNTLSLHDALPICMEIAILLGTLLSLLAYLHRTSHPAMRTMGFDARDPDRHFAVLDGLPDAMPECPQLKLLRMEGSVYFGAVAHVADRLQRSEEHTSELQSLMRISYAVFCLKKKQQKTHKK